MNGPHLNTAAKHDFLFRFYHNLHPATTSSPKSFNAVDGPSRDVATDQELAVTFLEGFDLCSCLTF